MNILHSSHKNDPNPLVSERRRDLLSEIFDKIGDLIRFDRIDRSVENNKYERRVLFHKYRRRIGLYCALGCTRELRIERDLCWVGRKKKRASEEAQIFNYASASFWT